MQVEVLHLHFHKGREYAAFSVVTDDLLLNIQLCSATLTELCLEGLHLEDCFDEFKRYEPSWSYSWSLAKAEKPD